MVHEIVFSPLDMGEELRGATALPLSWDPAGRCYERIPAELYHAGPGASSSMYRALGKSPRHVIRRSLFKGTPATRAGSVLHAMVFEPDLWRDQYVLLGSRPVAGNARPEHPKSRESLKAVVDAHAQRGLIALRDEDLEDTGEQLEEWSEEIRASQSFTDLGCDVMRAEVSWYWTNPAGLLERSRTDGAGATSSAVLLCDLKTVQDGKASAREVEKTILYSHMDMQAAMYSIGAAEVLGCKLADVMFAWLFFEKTSAAATAVYRATEEHMRTGTAKLVEARDRMARCLRTNKWPAYNGGLMVDAGCPAWALAMVDQGRGHELLDL